MSFSFVPILQDSVNLNFYYLGEVRLSQSRLRSLGLVCVHRMINHTVWTTILLVTGKGRGNVWRKTCLNALVKQSIPLCFKVKLALLKPSNTQLVIKGQKR